MNRKVLTRIGWAALGIAILGVLVLTGLYIRSVDQTPISQQQPQLTEEQQQQELTNALESLIEEDEAADDGRPDEKTAVLDDVRENGNELGVAVRTYDAPSNVFTIELIASIGDPQPGNEYISFVTDGVSSLRLGTLQKDVENTYTLSYSDKRDITGLDEIVVIESGESEEDVLQGFFE